MVSMMLATPDAAEGVTATLKVIGVPCAAVRAEAEPSMFSVVVVEARETLLQLADQCRRVHAA